MKAMILKKMSPIVRGIDVLEAAEVDEPVEREDELLVKVSACGVCHTEMDEIEGRTIPPTLPVIPGHQVVGRVVKTGNRTTRFRPGDRVGIAWIHSSCRRCEYCLRSDDNLCDEFRATGKDVHGGYAEFTTVPEDFAFAIPGGFTDVEAAPLLCAGTIGYRSLRLAAIEDGQALGLTGFGGSAHLVIQMARHKYPNSPICVFARSEAERGFARELGALWAGGTDEEPPVKLHAIIDTTPAWRPVVAALKNLGKGGRLVINAIRKEEKDKDSLMALDYPTHLWLEKEIKSVANVARRDVSEFLDLAAAIPIKPETQEFDLLDANTALWELKEGKIRGAKVLKVS